MAAEGGSRVEFTFNGENRNEIPRNVTHLSIDENITVIPARLFNQHPNLVEVRCHAGVLKIEGWAFCGCRSLRRVIIPGVKTVESHAFSWCYNLVVVECDKLERIEWSAFYCCTSLSSIHLPSVKIVEGSAFNGCTSLPHVIFGKDLESFEGLDFHDCTSLESITIPLRNGLLTVDDTFMGCENLKQVELVESEALRDFADALLLESWRSDLKAVIDSINQTLPNADPGRQSFILYENDNNGRKAIVIREWIGSVIRKIIQYKAAHNELLNKATVALQPFLPDDMLMNDILPFIELPIHKFDGEIDDGDESTNSDISNRGDGQESNDRNEGDAEE